MKNLHYFYNGRSTLNFILEKLNIDRDKKMQSNKILLNNKWYITKKIIRDIIDAKPPLLTTATLWKACGLSKS